MPAPPRECWGCTDTAFHANRFHLFRDCPNRNHPDVRQNFVKRFAAFRQSNNDNRGLDTQRYETPHSPSAHVTTTVDPSNWESDGWPSLDFAVLLSHITQLNTSPN